VSRHSTAPLLVRSYLRSHPASALQPGVRLTGVPSTSIGVDPRARHAATTAVASSSPVNVLPDRIAVPSPATLNLPDESTDPGSEPLIRRTFCLERTLTGVPSGPWSGENPVSNWFSLASQWLSLELNT